MSLVILIAPPGAGKGTQAEMLVREREYTHIESSELLKKVFNEAEPDNEVINQQKAKYDAGELNDSMFVSKLLHKAINESSLISHNIVLSGSPRTVSEATKEEVFFESIFQPKDIIIIHIKLDVKESVRRNSHRRICKLERHPIPSTPKFEDVTVCPWDGSELETRGKLDSPEIIRRRYEVYKSETEPVLEVFKEHGHRIHEVNGMRDIDIVSTDILKIVDDNSN